MSALGPVARALLERLLARDMLLDKESRAFVRGVLWLDEHILNEPKNETVPNTQSEPASLTAPNTLSEPSAETVPDIESEPSVWTAPKAASEPKPVRAVVHGLGALWTPERLALLQDQGGRGLPVGVLCERLNALPGPPVFQAALTKRLRRRAPSEPMTVMASKTLSEPEMPKAPSSENEPMTMTALGIASEPRAETAPKTQSEPDTQTAPDRWSELKNQTAPDERSEPRTETAPNKMSDEQGPRVAKARALIREGRLDDDDIATVVGLPATRIEYLRSLSTQP
jgi:hypothetical protein